MALTLRSSTSFVNLKDIRSSNTYDDFSSTVSFAQIKPTCRLQAKNSKQNENQLSHNRISPFEGGEKEGKGKLHEILHAHGEKGLRVPVFVMLPLDTVSFGGNLNRPRSMNASLTALKNAGVEGVMVDVWWGLVEKEGPMKYNWEGYAKLVKMVHKNGLKLQVVMSFHQCGENVGDSCSISLPPWVLKEISNNPDLLYTDMFGRRNPEYISLGCDSLHVLKGRTPIQVYSDYMRSFKESFQDYFGDVIVEIQVGMGPCGELRYPSYPESNGTWNFPGIGELQCYDKYMKSSLEATAEAAGKKDRGQSKPRDSGQYNEFPEETEFFRSEERWNTEYGRFFLEWYSSKLIEHGDKILTAAEGIFRGTEAKLSVKVAGIHWHYGTRSHAAELTTGYYNARQTDGYLPLARMLGKNGVVLNFTYMEMRDWERPENVKWSAEGIVRQVKMAIKTAGENALEKSDEEALAQVLETSEADSRNGLNAFTYLRMNKQLFEAENWRHFVEFLRSMVEGGRKTRLPDSDSTGTDLYFRFIK